MKYVHLRQAYTSRMAVTDANNAGPEHLYQLTRSSEPVGYFDHWKLRSQPGRLQRSIRRLQYTSCVKSAMAFAYTWKGLLLRKSSVSLESHISEKSNIMLHPCYCSAQPLQGVISALIYGTLWLSPIEETSIVPDRKSGIERSFAFSFSKQPSW
jgi:hypothetical protein